MTQRFIDFSNQRADAVRELRQADPPSQVASPPPSDSCVFCAIIYEAATAFKVYEDDHVIAFLDILPIIDGHTLLVPKKHYERSSQLPDDIGAAIGRTIPKLSRAILAATQQQDFNIIQNNGHGQVVPHVHFHLVPAPSSGKRWKPARSGMPDNRLGELDDEDGERIAAAIRAELDKARQSKM